VTKVLAVKDFSVSFGKVKVLDGINFDVDQGDFLMVLGPNGAGKSVLLKSILGIWPYTGQVKVFGQKIDLVRQKIGYVPQYVDFDRTFPLTVREVVSLGCRQNKSLSVCPHVNKVLEMVGMVGKIDDFFGQLSGGQVRRVLIARALAGQPKLLFLDEPLAGVDLVGEKSFYEMIAKWHQDLGLTTVMVSHDYSLVSRIATKVLCLNKKMTCFGGARDLTAKQFEDTFGRGVKLHVHNS